MKIKRIVILIVVILCLVVQGVYASSEREDDVPWIFGFNNDCNYESNETIIT